MWKVPKSSFNPCLIFDLVYLVFASGGCYHISPSQYASLIVPHPKFLYHSLVS